MADIPGHDGGQPRSVAAPISVELAKTPEQMEIAYRIRHDAYSADGHIEPRADRRFTDAYDELPNAFTFLVRVGDVPTGSVRICTRRVGSDDRLPCISTFPDAVAEFERKKSAATMLMEINRLTRIPDCIDGRVYAALFRTSGHMALYFDSQANFIALRRNHMPFYQRLGALQVARPRIYSGLNCEMSLCALVRPRFMAVTSNLPMFEHVVDDAAFRLALMAGERIVMPLPASLSISWANLPPGAAEEGLDEINDLTEAA